MKTLAFWWSLHHVFVNQNLMFFFVIITVFEYSNNAVGICFQYCIQLNVILLFLWGLHCESDCGPCVKEFWVVRVLCVSLTHGRS